MKTCCRCGKVKPYTEFWKKKASPDGYDTRCSDCLRAYSRDHYHNSPTRKKKIRINNKKWVKGEKDKFEAYLVGKKCVDCGNKDRRVFEFDHISDDKEFNISDGLSRCFNWERILTEIQKCELVCANCHRIRTVERRKALQRPVAQG